MKIIGQQILYFLYWIVFFVSSRIIFVAYHHIKTATLTTGEILKVFLYGLRLDASFTGYICILPFLCFCLQPFISYARVKKALTVYTYILIILLSFLTIADLELYKAWGFRLDATPLQYFKNPKEMGASISASPIVLLLGIFLLLCIFFI